MSFRNLTNLACNIAAYQEQIRYVRRYVEKANILTDTE